MTLEAGGNYAARLNLFFMFDEQTAEIFPDHYIPAPPGLAEFNTRLADLYGQTDTGLPRWRVVWGMDEKIFMNGKWSPKFNSPRSNEFGIAAFWLEAWGPAPDTAWIWNQHRYQIMHDGKLVDALGEWPKDGVYHPKWMMALNGEPLPLGEKMFEVCQRLITLEYEALADPAQANRDAIQADLRAAAETDKRIQEELRAESAANWREAEAEVAASHRAYSVPMAA